MEFCRTDLSHMVAIFSQPNLGATGPATIAAAPFGEIGEIPGQEALQVSDRSPPLYC